jgi:hypothetical protein
MAETEIGGELAALQNLETPDDVTKDDAETEVTEDDDTKESEKSESDESGDKDDSEEDSDKNEEVEDEDDEDEDKDEASLYNKLKAHDATLLKKIPELREVIFREQELTKYFPTVDDAKEASAIVDSFHEFESQLNEGRSDDLITALDKNKVLDKFAANFLPTLQEHSKDKYLQVISPEIKRMLRFAAESGNKDIALSAKNIHWFVFNNTNFDEHVGYKPTEKKSEKELSLEEKERSIETQKRDFFTTDLQNSLDKRLNNIIGESLKDSGMKPFILKKVTEDIISKIYKAAGKDKNHGRNMNSLWSQAKRAGYTPEWKDRIKSAALSRARGLLSTIRKEVLTEAGMSPAEKKEKKPVRLTPNGKVSSTDRPRAKDIDWSKTDPLEMMQGKAPTLKVRK